MKRKLLSVFLSLAMVLTMMPVFAMADTSVGGGTPGANSGSSVEASGIDSYEALVKAISDAEDGATITLAGDIKATSTITIDKTITLTGGSISAADGFTGGSLISLETEGKTLTLGNVTLNANKKARVVYCNAGKIIVNGATITGGKAPDRSYIGGVYMTNASQFEMNSGSITGNEVSDAYKNDEYLQYSADLWIGANAKGAMTDINGGTVGSIFVNANEFSANNPGSFKMNNGTVENIYVEYDKGYGATFTYNGGTLNNLCISTVKGNGDKVKIDKPLPGMTYTGGKTSAEEIAPVASVGSYVYESLQAAVNAAESGATVTLIKNTNQGFAVPAGLEITFDVNGKNLEREGQDIQNNGTLTICDSTNTKQGKIISKGGVAIGVGDNSNTTIEYANVESVEGAVITGYATGATITIKDGKFNASDNAVIAGNGNKTNSKREERLNPNTINILGGTFNGAIKSPDYVACGIYAPYRDTITVEGGIFNITNGAGIVARAGNVTVSGGEFHVTGNVTGKVGDSRVVVSCKPLVFDSEANYPAMTDDSKITVTGGKFTSENQDIAAICAKNGDITKRIAISGGYFNNSFSKEFCATGKMVIDNTDKVYKYTVGTIEATGDNEVKADTVVGETKAVVSDKINGANKANAENVGKSVTPITLTDTTPITENDKNDALTELVKNNKIHLKDGKIPKDITVKVVKETYFDVTVTGYDTGKNEISMDITPKYNLKAKVEPSENTEFITIKPAQNATVTAPTKVSVTLPKDTFAGKKVYITHKNDIYVAIADEKGKIEFTTNGFSPFTFALSDPRVVAEVNGNAYTSLQAAVDAATSGSTIEIVGGGTSNEYTATMTGSTKTITVKNSTTAEKITVKVNGDSEDIAKDKTVDFTYTRHSSSGSSTTTYTVTVGSVSNGTVTSSHKSAASGATVTLTVKPADGYAVEAVTAKDAKGNAVKVTEKDGKYTFAMPASNVTVSASFVKKGEQPAAKLFDDVAQGAYYYDAVKWAVDKGVTNGKTSNLFGSDDPCTRAQIVTFLWRAAGSPAASASVSFTDVKDSDYYAKAVAWAVEKGITNGTGDGKFSSDDTCTRAQCAAFLYRAAGSPEVTDAAAFSDVAADAYYAKAVAWAEKNGITNGLGNGKFGSDNSCTRAQIITFLYRTYQGK